MVVFIIPMVIKLVVSIVSFIILVIIGVVAYNKFKSERLTLKKSDMVFESFYNTGFVADNLYKGSFKSFLDKVEKDKTENASVLGSVQNPMSDRNYNTRILYQEGQDVYKF